MVAELMSPEAFEAGRAGAGPALEAAGSGDRASGHQVVAVSADEEGASPPRGPGTQLQKRRALKARGARKRIVIHAGVHRTGSTAIQHMLSTGRAGLLAQGVVYPDDCFASDHQSQHEMSHNGLAGALLRGEAAGGLVLEWLARVVPPSCDTVVLSAQDFCRLRDVSFLATLQNQYDVEAVFYLRRQDHWLSSWYNYNVLRQQNPKLSLMTPMEFLDQTSHFHWLRYFDLLERWAQFIDRDNVHVRALGRGQTSDSAEDFLALLGVRTSVGRVRMNMSVSADTLELARRLRLWKLPTRSRATLIEALEALPSERSTEVYSAPVRKLFVQRYMAQNQLVAQRYLDHPAGALFLDDEYPEDDRCRGAPVMEQLALKLIGALLGGAE